MAVRAAWDASHNFLWRMAYGALRRVAIDYPSGSPLFYSPGEGFGDWGYHERTDAGDGFLRHEILFATESFLPQDRKCCLSSKSFLVRRNQAKSCGRCLRAVPTNIYSHDFTHS